jgi:hypothetical protein
MQFEEQRYSIEYYLHGRLEGLHFVHIKVVDKSSHLGHVLGQLSRALWLLVNRPRARVRLLGCQVQLLRSGHQLQKYHKISKHSIEIKLCLVPV